MSQRLKARQFVQQSGHGSELRGITTRVAPKTPTAPQFPNQALEAAQTSPTDGLQTESTAMPPGLARGGRC